MNVEFDVMCMNVLPHEGDDDVKKGVAVGMEMVMILRSSSQSARRIFS
jgi:hypothetical protein